MFLYSGPAATAKKFWLRIALIFDRCAVHVIPPLYFLGQVLRAGFPYVIVASRRQSDSIGFWKVGAWSPSSWRLALWARGLLQPAARLSMRRGRAASFKLTPSASAHPARVAGTRALWLARWSARALLTALPYTSRVVGSESSPTPTSLGSARATHTTEAF